ncbi:outer membrane immunogenic protein [Afipia massiliensis]|uniref:Outer membrane immunogenic protein n=1 Tax=Afipia massiliensis TaxID=211460 RepID=A0A840N782_9BRAD|nr:outer membrane beta-barrel protein [Afipia massiliensis]MBB5054712.1 outer membrane immunogenic protein [Afipia massiliensis]
MKALLIAAAVVAFGATGTQAADIAARPYIKAPVAPVVSYNWSGCYVGGNVGGGWHRVEQQANSNVAGAPFVPPLAFGSSEGSAVIGGVQVGCDYQFAGNWVIGVQGMFDFGDINSKNTLPDPRVTAIGAFQQTTTRDVYTATARLGYLLTPQVLGYVKGGGAWTRVGTEVFGTIPSLFLSETAHSNRAGWTVGGGLEWMFAPNWSVFVEYNYMDFGRTDIAFVNPPGNIGTPTLNATRLTLQTALVGVNYKFNWGGPVVAKY